MCFSSDASLGVGAALLPVGVYCIQRSLKKDISYLPLATVPFFFGVQQIIEGFVWKGLESGDPQLVTRASLVFLAFALVFWPFWIPLSAVTIENHGRTRTANSIFAILGLAFGLYSYLPVLFNSENGLVTKVEFHSIQYDFGTFSLFQFVPALVWHSCYVIVVSLPFLISKRGSLFRIFGVLLGASAILGQFAFYYAFISVWCLFAAVLSLYLIVIFWRLSTKTPIG